jgi:dsDNA-specific endonuclease/ATPase MutS2
MTDETNDDPPDEMEPIEIPIGDVLDLHPFRPAEVSPLVDDYLREAHAAGFRRVRLIHGKGTGTLKRGVQALLSRHELVETFFDADHTSGSWGATVVIMKDSPHRHS